jgi:hypothetical protein
MFDRFSAAMVLGTVDEPRLSAPAASHAATVISGYAIPMSSDEDSADDTESAPERAPVRPNSAKKTAIKTEIDPQVAAGLGRCLRARLAQLDRDIIQAKEFALRDPFYARSADNLLKIRTEAAKHLVEFEGNGGKPA